MAINPQVDPVAAFRLMTIDDVVGIMKIESQIYDHPWTEGIFRDCIRVGYHGWVYDVDNDIQAYGLISVAANEAHILNLCVAPAFQGQGLGKKMLSRLMDTAEALNVKSVFLEVRVSNDIAISLYDKSGFNQLGVRKDYYPADKNGREDALVFGKEINTEHEENQ
jgi:[ribosomal protein S18]-alanine N-acetyltransferase